VERDDFDSFGERVNRECSLLSGSQRPMAGWLANAGTVLFWSLVVTILVARVASFDPGIYGKPGPLAAFSQLFLAVPVI
jgi:hypothetical protein